METTPKSKQFWLLLATIGLTPTCYHSSSCLQPPPVDLWRREGGLEGVVSISRVITLFQVAQGTRAAWSLDNTTKKFVFLIFILYFSDCFVIMSWETVDGNTQGFVAEINHNIFMPNLACKDVPILHRADFLHGWWNIYLRYGVTRSGSIWCSLHFTMLPASKYYAIDYDASERGR